MKDGKSVERTSGIIKQVIGPTIDFEFDSDHLPNILNAIVVQDESKGINVTSEVVQHVGNNVVRAVSMQPVDGLVRGMVGLDTGSPIKVPVGSQCLGRMFKHFSRSCHTVPITFVRKHWEECVNILTQRLS